MPSRRTIVAATGTLLATAGCVGDLPSPSGGAGTTETPTGTPDRSGDGDGEAAVADAVRYELHHSERDDEWVLATGDDVRQVGAATSRSGRTYVPVTLSASGQRGFEEAFEAAGVADSPEEFAVHTVVDGETVYEAGVAPGLVESVDSGEWEGRFRTSTPSMEEAERLEARLRGDEASG